MTVELPDALVPLVDALAAVPGAVAVALGGSRAAGDADAQSDWDFALYYRGTPDLRALERFGTVYPPGSWGRIMNGGGWFQIGGLKADVMLRDLDVVEHWSERAERGEYEVDALLGYVAGAPTYMLSGERSLGVVLRGALPAARGFPERLAAAAPARWRYHRDFTLMHARARAERGDAVGAVGQAAKAAIEEAHARLAERGEWALNEKRIVERAGLAHVHDLFARTPREPAALLDRLRDVERALGAAG
jgi:hypothetical protein